MRQFELFFIFYSLRLHDLKKANRSRTKSCRHRLVKHNPIWSFHLGTVEQKYPDFAGGQLRHGVVGALRQLEHVLDDEPSKIL